jgi:MFS family permease
VTNDIAGKSGRFNFCLGLVGFAMGIGATISTSLAGWIADTFGEAAAFLTFAAIAAAGVLLVWTALPETLAKQARAM